LLGRQLRGWAKVNQGRVNDSDHTLSLPPARRRR
jgi:hypothetical protein